MSSAAVWLENFGIADREGTPDLAFSPGPGLAHGSAMRAAFDRAVDAFLLVDGMPTIAFAIRDQLDREEIDKLHHALWNQGLASVLVVQLPTEVRVYSLWQRPVVQGTQSAPGEDRRLVETLDLARQALEVRGLVPAVESGQYVERHREHFDPDARIDSTLLSNLRQTLLQLRGVPDGVARALILQIVFIAYLEDRGHIEKEDYQKGVGEPYGCLLEVLSTRDPRLLDRLFRHLRKTFNGDVFRAPGVFETPGKRVVLEPRHIDPIVRFREGKLNMASGQGRFWPYDFKFIPVELISAIYDRFLNQDNEKRQETGAYFTPRFLADLVVDQLWSSIDSGTRVAPTVLDPACGSAIFLVRMFQKIVDEWKHAHANCPPDWDTLRGIVERLHGWDIEEGAVLIGVFSLYVAMLEQVQPPAISALKAQGKVLPLLLGRTLRNLDFFEEENFQKHFDIIVGNPPWVSKKSKQTRSALKWCRDHGRPAPQGEIAWAFLWKCTNHLTAHGWAALLLPAMGVLLNHSQGVNDARSTWLETVEVLRIINLSDGRFQLFDDAKRPTILALYRLPAQPGRDYDIEYWVPKAHRLLSSTRLLIIPSVDRSTVRMSMARKEPEIWKKRMWATDRDVKLLSWLDDLPKLGRILTTHSQARHQKPARAIWIIGQGFQPFHGSSEGERGGFKIEDAVTRYPFLDAGGFCPWVLPTIHTAPWKTSRVRRRGFVDGFRGPHILIPKGVDRSGGRVRATYVEQSLCFRHSLQAIRFPRGEEQLGKLLTTVLNSSLAAWYYFHSTANVGADRPVVDEEQLLDLPFPRPQETPDPSTSRHAEEKLVGLIDDLLSHKDDALGFSGRVLETTKSADELVFDYYGLTQTERALVRDCVQSIIPSMQPRRDERTPLMHESDSRTRETYADTLVAALNEWMRPGVKASARLLDGGYSGVAVIELRLGSEQARVQIDRQPRDLENALRKIMDKLPITDSRNIELRPDLKVIIDDKLYLTKPLSARYWLASSALNDADEVAADLLSAEARARREAGNEHYR
jgi:hypothetical protein